jgi:uncharacterized YccA/Bax inhibitor family protein
MANNPAVSRFAQITRTPSSGELQSMYDAPAYTPARYMTLDDVVVRTAAMLAVLLATGGVAWGLTGSGNVGPVLIVALLGGTGLGLYIGFTGKANAVTSLIYAALEGVVLGTISRVLNNEFPGIVIQAVTGTAMVAVGVLIAYKVGAIRVTPKFTRMTLAATFGALGLLTVNLISYLFTPNGLGLNNGSGWAILVSILLIAIAAMNLVIDFDIIEQGIRRGADQKFAWYASFGLMVTLIWLYIEVLRLLANMRR